MARFLLFYRAFGVFFMWSICVQGFLYLTFSPVGAILEVKKHEGVNMIEINVIGSKWKHDEGFVYSRNSYDEYIFIHFMTPVVLDGNEVGAGTVILYGRNTNREFYSPKGKLVHDWIHMVGQVEELAESCGIELGVPYSVSDSNLISSLVENMQQELTKCRTGYRQMVNCKVEELFITISREINEPGDSSASETRLAEFEALRRQVLTSFAAPWTVEKMAERVYLSPSRFFDTYREIFGTTPKADLQNARISEAKTLLLKGASVESVAFAVGYNSIYHFIRQFRRVVGVSPGRFAKSGAQPK